ncbi:lytic transglycosylase domain-containing protein [Orrella sp. JC864]|uniref:lytic transglycosylase domain-containing protein n=1 Tax=Orrella sp. JC864 TaxID=3120298 RepID=UPI0012BCEA34
MSDASDTPTWRRLAVTAHHYLAELVRTSAVYLGIAVLVAATIIVALPGLRDQALQAHSAMVAALAPESVQNALPSETAGIAPESPASPTGALGMPGVRNFLGAIGSVPPVRVLNEQGITREQVEALRGYISRKYRVAYDATGVLVNTAFLVGHELDLDPILLLAVMAIESRYNPFAESHVGAQGLMQVMTRVHREKFEPFGGGDGVALNPVANIKVGGQILRDCIDRRGSRAAGLACYVGATGPSDGGYGAKVQAERRRLALAAGVPLAKD